MARELLSSVEMMRSGRLSSLLAPLGATRMSCLLLILGIAACGGGTNGTSLSTPVPCDQMTCPAGDLCKPQQNAPDDGSIPARCIEVPAGCPVMDCGYSDGPNCPACLQDACGFPPGSNYFIVVRDREINC
jgi:hypothetical protein